MILPRRRMRRFIPALFLAAVAYAARLFSVAAGLREYVKDHEGHLFVAWSPFRDPNWEGIIIAYMLNSLYLFAAMTVIAPLGCLVALSGFRGDRLMREEAAVTPIDPRVYLMFRGGFPLLATVLPVLILFPIDAAFALFTAIINLTNALPVIVGSMAVMLFCVLVFLIHSTQCVLNCLRKKSGWNILLFCLWPLAAICLFALSFGFAAFALGFVSDSKEYLFWISLAGFVVILWLMFRLLIHLYKKAAKAVFAFE